MIKFKIILILYSCHIYNFSLLCESSRRMTACKKGGCMLMKIITDPEEINIVFNGCLKKTLQSYNS